jgi:ABC-type uncharacterized transport system substrate-binding protein
VLTRREADEAAERLRMRLKAYGVDGPKDFDRAFDAIAADHVDAVLVATSPMFRSHRHPLVDLALKHRLPTMFSVPEFAEAGGLMTYGPSTTELVINLKTAKALGLTIPPSPLQRADQVIE